MELQAERFPAKYVVFRLECAPTSHEEQREALLRLKVKKRAGIEESGAIPATRAF